MKWNILIVLVLMVFVFQTSLSQAQSYKNTSGSINCPTLTEPLKFGSRGESVVDLQEYLISTGHYTYSRGATGYFGQVTKRAVSAWQSSNNISPASGYWGPLSLAKYESICINSSQKASTNPTTSDPNEIFSTISAQAKQPNIIVIMTDDQDDGLTKIAIPKTLNLIGKEGVTFKNSFVDNSLCCPSRTTSLTGQNSNNSGIFFLVPGIVFNGILYGGGYSDFRQTEGNILPVWLKNAGYRTAMIGKYVNGYSLQNDPVPPGWDKWFSVRPFYFNYTANVDGVPIQYGSSPDDYVTEVLTEEAISFIKNQTGPEPFFLMLNHPAPHVDVGTNPYLPTSAPKYSGRYATAELPNSPSFNEADISDKPAFLQNLNPLLSTSDIEYNLSIYQKALESLLSVDDSVEDIINTLNDEGYLNNTVIIYTSDNGFLYGEHRRIKAKVDLYEESIRVPLMIRGPGIPADLVRDELVNNVDLPATIVELAGVTPGRVLDGRSLVPLLTNQPSSWRTALLIQSSRTGNSLFDVRDIYRGIRTKNLVYAEHETLSKKTEYEFYDLRVDPFQLESKHLDPLYESVIQNLRNKLQILKSCQGATCWMTSPEPALPTPPLESLSLELIAHWKFDSTNKDIARDSSRNGIHGSLVNMEDSDWVSGVSGNALNFDGRNEYVALPGLNSVIDTSQGSLAMWIKPGPKRSLTVAFSAKKDRENNIEFLMNGNEFIMKWKGSNNVMAIRSNAISNTDGVWRHAVLTWDKATDEVKAYVDGVQDGSTLTNMSNFIGNITNEVKIGAQGISGGSNFFEGQIDDVRIYNKALTQAEINSIYVPLKTLLSIKNNFEPINMDGDVDLNSRFFNQLANVFKSVGNMLQDILNILPSWGDDR
jgi:N-acetylglucosamine-6-sulfatase